MIPSSTRSRGGAAAHHRGSGSGGGAGATEAPGPPQKHFGVRLGTAKHGVPFFSFGDQKKWNRKQCIHHDISASSNDTSL